MSSLLDELLGSIGPGLEENLSRELGIPRNQAGSVIREAGPIIIGGMKRQRDTRGGDPRVEHILEKYGKPDVLDDIGGTVRRQVERRDTDPDLGGLVGGNGERISEHYSEKLNINLDLAKKILPILAPLILGAMTRRRNTSSAGMGGLGAILDRDGDGSILDDIGGYLGGGGGGLGGGGYGQAAPRRRGGGLLGTILGFLLKMFLRRR